MTKIENKIKDAINHGLSYPDYSRLPIKTKKGSSWEDGNVVMKWRKGRRKKNERVSGDTGG